jgi:hypothetical protein
MGLQVSRHRPRFRDSDHGFFAVRGYDVELYPPLLSKENRFRRVALRTNDGVPFKAKDRLPAPGAANTSRNAREGASVLS